MSRPRALVVCPGRGSYTRESLGYLRRHAGHPAAGAALAAFEAERGREGRPPLGDLDAAPAAGWDPALYLGGENAAALTFAAGFLDWEAVRGAVRPVAVCGNSMGWYTALGVAGALAPAEAFRLADGMGNLQGLGSGGQLMFPAVDAEWRAEPGLLEEVERALGEARAAGHAAWRSIRLGGHQVLGADDGGLAFLEARLPRRKLGTREYPLRLPHHAAFHTPLMEAVAAEAPSRFARLGWRAPEIPLVDGRGFVFRPRWASVTGLFGFTLGQQVVGHYDFTASVRVALREYAPEVLLLLGPGETLGGPVGQILVAEGWQGIRSRGDFLARQERDPVVLATARPGVLASLGTP